MKPTKTKSFMKQLLTFSSVLAFTAAGGSFARAQSSPVLYNGDLNLIGGPGVVEANPCPLGWNVNGGLALGPEDDMCDSETFCNGADDPNVSGSGLFLKPFQGTTNPIPNLAFCYFYQNNPSFPGTTYTLSAWVCGQANYSGYQTGTPSFPGTGLYLEFLDNSGNVLALHQYDLIAAGLNNMGDPVPSVQYTTPVYTAPAGTVTVQAGIYMTNVWNTTGAQSLLADDFDLEATVAPGAPNFTTEPAAATAPVGGHASFTVAASPAPTSYSWNLNGAPVSGPEFSGASTATLTVSPVSTNDVGHYTCVVANGAGGNISLPAPLAINALDLFPTVALTGTLYDTYVIERSSSVNGPYTPFSTNTITARPQYIIDFTLPVSPSEFYQEVFLK